MGAMDLRAHRRSPAHVGRAVDLVGRGLLCYQPFIFSDDFETGAGLEFVSAEFDGMVYMANPPQRYLDSPEIRRFLIDPAKREQFSDGNRRLRALYESFIDAVEAKLGPASGYSFAEVGCCSGYFPVSFARRGSPRAVGFDRVDYAPSFDLLNSILGTKARFVHRPYRVAGEVARGRLKWLRALRREFGTLVQSMRHPWLGIGGGPGRFDVVFSIAVLVHLSDPLEHLAYLGQMARKALLVWTSTLDDENAMTIRYEASNRYYREDRFPYCFDVVKMSPALLRRSLELMGFTEIHPIANRPDGMPDDFFRVHRGYLAIRPQAS